jgi:16S rRNA pseudouridine516 synthase
MPRLDQLLSSLGYGSRREVRDLLRAGRITCKGESADDPGEKVAAADVRVDGEALDHPEGLLIVMHKPTGHVCSHDAREGPSVYDLLPERWRRRNPSVTTVGRLDKETSGTLLLTDQSPLVHRLTSPRHKLEKVYRATLDRAADPAWAEILKSGTLMLDGETKPCAPAQLQVAQLCEIELTLTEGRYHQVRRMVAALGATVLRLHRIRFGNLSADDLEPGTWRELPLDMFG